MLQTSYELRRIGTGNEWIGTTPDQLDGQPIDLGEHLELYVRVLLFALGTALVTTLLSGLAPAVHAIGRDLYERAKSTGKGGSALRYE